jgi:F420-non-reducing hydrogenase iron-sulfur subunit
VAHSELQIIVFLCNWCSYESADAAGRAGLPYPHETKIVRVMCTGRIDPRFILRAFKNGADGVLVLGCRPGECHYKEGNLHARRRLVLMKKLVPQFGIEPERLAYDWISATDHRKLVEIIDQVHELLTDLGPLGNTSQQGVAKWQ